MLFLIVFSKNSERASVARFIVTRYYGGGGVSRGVRLALLRGGQKWPKKALHNI